MGFWTFPLSSLNTHPTCIQNLKKSNCISLVLKNFKPSFMKTNVFGTGISDHHKMTSTVVKLHFTKESPKGKYRDCSKFDLVLIWLPN